MGSTVLLQCIHNLTNEMVMTGQTIQLLYNYSQHHMIVTFYYHHGIIIHIGGEMIVLKLFTPGEHALLIQ